MRYSSEVALSSISSTSKIGFAKLLILIYRFVIPLISRESKYSKFVFSSGASNKKIVHDNLDLSA